MGIFRLLIMTNTSSDITPATSASPEATTLGSGLGFPAILRLPPTGEHCKYSALTRSALNYLILPSSANQFHPPVRSYCLRRPGAKKGLRLIDGESLKSFILSCADGVTNASDKSNCREKVADHEM